MTEMRKEHSAASHAHPWALLTVIVGFAFVSRLAVRFAFGEEFFWSNAHHTYYELAREYGGSQVVCKSDLEAVDVVGKACGYLPPLYALMLAIVIGAGNDYQAIVALQAMISAGTVLIAYYLGRQLFGWATGILACVLIALYPYYMLHDTALQETGLFTFLAALSVLLLLRAKERASWRLSAVAGVVLALAVLARLTLVAFVPLAFGWLVVHPSRSLRSRLSLLVAAVLPFILTLLPWLARGQVAVGGPLMNNHAGVYLWLSNNPRTFSHYPEESMDLSSQAAWATLSPDELQQVEVLSGQGGWRLEWWFARRALRFMWSEPGLVLRGMLAKVWAAYNWRLNPVATPLFQLAYTISYVPVLVFGIAGWMLSRNRWRDFSLVYLLFGAFTVVAAVFFAHTTHRTYLDVFLMVFAARALQIGSAWVLSWRRGYSSAITWWSREAA